LSRLKSAVYGRMEDMSFRSGAAVVGAALAVVGAVIALVVMLTGHDAAAAFSPPPAAANRVAGPASSAPASATSAVPSATARPRHSKVPRTVARTYAQAPPPRPHTAAPRPRAPGPSPSAHFTTQWPEPLKWAPTNPKKRAPSDWRWAG
jgi:hypothetical protein